MQQTDLPDNPSSQGTKNDDIDNKEASTHKHNPFEDKKDTLTKEEEAAIEQFKEAQTERD